MHSPFTFFIYRLLSVATLALLAACASTHGYIDRQALAAQAQSPSLSASPSPAQSQSQAHASKLAYDNPEIEAAFTKKANLPKPFRLAFYFRPSTNAQWRWTEDDKALVQAAMEDLHQQGVVASAFPILSNLVKDPDDIKSIRLAAAQYHADALMIVTGAGEVKRSLNSLGMTYVLLLPAVFVHGSQADSLFFANAVMYDVRNESLYLSVEAEGADQKRFAELVGTDDQALLRQSKTMALAHLTDELKSLVKSVKP